MYNDSKIHANVIYIYCNLLAAGAIDIEDVLRAVEDVENFMELGKWLSVPDCELHEIKQRHTTEMERKRGVLEYWFKMDPSKSWRRVIWALDIMTEHQIADEIRDNAEPVLGMYVQFTQHKSCINHA